MTSTNFRVAKDRLPVDREERFDTLHSYFCELWAWAEEADGEWEIAVSRPDRAAYYVDPNLPSGLDWYSRTFGAVDVAAIAHAVHRSPAFQLSLNDSWTLWSWALWLNHRSLSDLDVTILHVDDHDDLMTPRLLVRDRIIDALTGKEFRLDVPSTVEPAIRSGAIGVGSFMSPFIRAARRVDVRHLCATAYARKREGQFRLVPTSVPDALLYPKDVSPGLRLDAAAADEPIDRRYSVTDNLDLWLRDLRPGPVLLHVDMDYFNNRFNCSSDWQDSENHDPDAASVLQRIEEMINALRRGGVLQRIEDIAIALSPGFFPAELWQPSIELMQRLLPSSVEV